MLRPRRTNAWLVLLLVLLAAMLGVLATLQYRWIDRISEAERQQMRANMDFAARRFADDLMRELEPLVATFEAHDDIALARPELVQAVYEVVREDDQWMLDDGRALVPWPEELLSIRDRLNAAFRDRQAPPSGPFLGDIPALMLVERRPPPMFEEAVGGPQTPVGGGDDDEFGGPHPPAGSPADRRPPAADSFQPRVPRIVIIQLSRQGLRDTVLPRLAHRHFGKESDVAIVVASNNADVLYRSDPSWPDGRTAPDVQTLLEPVTRRDRGGPPAMGRPRMRGGEGRANNGIPWRLIARRHDGSIDAIVSNARRRNLAISFGIVLILGAAVLLMAVLLRREERLRQQQLEFVAAISHELNTPVAALRSAGENLRDGIIHDNAKVARYGQSIVRESTRLGELTSQVLELAGIQKRRARANETFAVAPIIEDAIAQCAWLIEGTNVRIESNVDSDLPQLSGDANAITRAVQNLIANAIRHGGAGEWVGVRATREGDGVRITVEDRGPGVDPADARQLFDAFYRGRNSSAVPGAGLGLAIVRQIATSHGGTVRIDKKRGGASFTIELPAVTHA